uniref:Uncharacterized protein n=1 Tax=Poecilia reticulata TaxID=8081 RepID=A0A3P9QHV1_POERE
SKFLTFKTLKFLFDDIHHIYRRWSGLTHWPTEELHPTMQLSSQECDRTLDPFSTVHRFILTPSSTTTPAPMVTFGPMVQFSPICAVGSFWM